MSEETTSSANDVNEKTSKRKYEEVVPTSKKEKKPPMPCYGKYNILKMLKENHCLFPDEDQLSNAFARYKRYSLDEIKQFINKSAQKSQKNSDKNNKSPEFKRANELIKSIEQRDPFTNRTLDIPLSLKTITDVFKYEDEEVDVRMLYQTLTNLSLGFPTTYLDSATNDFLYGVYKEFLETVDTPEFQEDVRKYQNFFSSKRNACDDRADVKHPTDSSDIELVVKSALNSSSINPLNIPYSLLHKPKDTF